MSRLLALLVPDMNSPPKDRPSQWLHDTMSEFDGKVMAIWSLLETEEDGKKQEILKILKELTRSYSTMAESHGHLRSNTKMAIASATYDGHRTGASSDPESSGSEVLEEPTNKVSEVDNAPEQEFKVPGYLEWETKEEECHFEVMKLIEENLQQQAELVRRNEEKRGIIKRLQMEIEVLKTEVRTPQECPKIDLKRTQSTSSKSIPTKKPGLGVIRKAIMTFSRACH